MLDSELINILHSKIERGSADASFKGFFEHHVEDIFLYKYEKGNRAEQINMGVNKVSCANYLLILSTILHTKY